MEQTTCLVGGGVSPLQLPWKTNTLNKQGRGSTRGIAISIGDPPQFISPPPAINQNNTFVVNVGLCKNDTDYSCIAEYHGVYAPPNSVNSTTQLSSWNGTNSQEVSSQTEQDFVFFNDKFSVGGKTIPGVPFFSYSFRSGEDVAGSGLAIGRNSSFIETAAAARVIPNKAWSLWPGLDDIDGALILGGYDEDRAASDFTEFEVGKNGSLVVDIIGIEWQPLSGSSVDLMPNDTKILRGYLEPFYGRTGLPTTAYNKFASATNGTYGDSKFTNWFEKPLGNLVFTLSNGMKTYIPDDDLFYYPWEYDDRGVKTITNYTFYHGKVFEDVQSLEETWMGEPYMAQHLVISDFHRGKWWMADAVKKDLGPTATNVRPLCTEGPVSPSHNQTVSTGANVAAIGGGVGGGVGVLLLAALGFCMYRRKKKTKHVEEHSRPTLSPNLDKHTTMRDAYSPGPGSPPPTYPVTTYEGEKSPIVSELVSPQHYSPTYPGSPLGSPQMNVGYTPYNRMLDPAQHELSGLNIATSPNAYTYHYPSVSPEPQEMPTGEHPYR